MQPPIMHFDPAEIAHVPTTGVRRVHVRVSVYFAKEFGCYLAVPMRRPGA